MDYSDESYVRLYPRKTLTHKLLGWEGRAVMHAMLGEFDAAGIFPIRGEAARCVAAVTEIPDEVARVGLARLVETETWVVTARVITWPTYEEAQNCRRSDRLRQRESRRARSVEAVTNRDAKSHCSVTEVTSCHTESQLVTLPPSAPSAPSLPLHPLHPLDLVAAKAPKAKRGSRLPASPKPEIPLPADWVPSAAHRAFCVEHRLNLDLEVTSLKGWAEGRTAISWNGTFTTRLVNAVKWARENPGKAQPNGRKGGSIGPVTQTYEEAMARFK